MTRVFYRVVKAERPTLEDFQSHVARRGPAPIANDPVKQHMAEGISVFATLPQARRNARSFPGHGGFVAQLLVRDDAPLAVERTGRQPGHHTIWGEPGDLLRSVVSVVSV